MNIDFISEYLKKSIPEVHLIGFPDTGLFLDGTQFEISKDWYKMFMIADSLWGSTKKGNSNSGCLAIY